VRQVVLEVVKPSSHRRCVETGLQGSDRDGLLLEDHPRSGRVEPFAARRPIFARPAERIRVGLTVRTGRRATWGEPVCRRAARAGAPGRLRRRRLGRGLGAIGSTARAFPSGGGGGARGEAGGGAGAGWPGLRRRRARSRSGRIEMGFGPWFRPRSGGRAGTLRVPMGRGRRCSKAPTRTGEVSRCAAREAVVHVFYGPWQWVIRGHGGAVCRAVRGSPTVGVRRTVEMTGALRGRRRRRV